MAIEGNLSDMNVSALVQYLCNEGQQACLRIEHGSHEARLYFEAGNITHAELDDRTGEEVFYQVLRWKDGAFTLEPTGTPPTRTIETPWSALLMNGLQQLDEETWDHTTDEEDYAMPENIQEILEELGGQVPGLVAVTVVGMDGLGIADYSATGANVEAINAQTTLLLKLVETTVNKLNADDAVADYLLTTQDAYLLVRFLSGHDYFLGIVAERDSTRLGNLRLNSRLYTDRVDKALPH